MSLYKLHKTIKKLHKYAELVDGLEFDVNECEISDLLPELTKATDKYRRQKKKVDKLILQEAKRVKEVVK